MKQTSKYKAERQINEKQDMQVNIKMNEKRKCFAKAKISSPFLL